MNSSILCVGLHPHDRLALKLAKLLEIPLYIPTFTQFADGEIEVDVWQEFLWDKKEVVLVASTVYDIPNELMKALFFINAIKQRGVKKCTWVMPYCGYSRQIIDSSGRYAGNMSVVAKMIESSGVDQLIVIEPHDIEIRNLFTIPLYIKEVSESIAHHILRYNPNLTNACVVSPDEGGIIRAELVARLLRIPVVMVQKERTGPNQIQITGIHNYQGYKTAFIVDDILDTGDTALTIAATLKDLGVENVHGYFVHGIFSHGMHAILTSQLLTSITISQTVHPRDYSESSILHTFEISQTLEQIVTHLRQ